MKIMRGKAEGESVNAMEPAADTRIHRAKGLARLQGWLDPAVPKREDVSDRPDAPCIGRFNPQAGLLAQDFSSTAFPPARSPAVA